MAEESDFIIRIILRAKDDFSKTFKKVVDDVDRSVTRTQQKQKPGGSAAGAVATGTLFERIFGNPQKEIEKAKRDLQGNLFGDFYNKMVADANQAVNRARAQWKGTETFFSRIFGNPRKEAEEASKAVNASIIAMRVGQEKWAGWRAATASGGFGPSQTTRVAESGARGFEREAILGTRELTDALFGVGRSSDAASKGLGEVGAHAKEVVSKALELGKKASEIREKLGESIKKHVEGAEEAGKKTVEVAKKTGEAAEKIGGAVKSTAEVGGKAADVTKAGAGAASDAAGAASKAASSAAEEGKNKLGLLGSAWELLGAKMGIIVLVAPMLVTGLLSLVGALIALASSAAMAGAALGGALVAGIGQAIPAVGLLFAAFARIKTIMEIAGKQYDLHQQKLAMSMEAMDRNRAAAQGLIHAQEGLRDSVRGLADARREAARQLEDLVIAERTARLEAEASSLAGEDAQIRLKAALATGGIHDIREARLAVERSKAQGQQAQLGVTRTAQDAGRLVPLGVEGQPAVIAAQHQLRDATWALAAAQREAARAASGQSGALEELAQQIKMLSPAERDLLEKISHLREVWEKVARPITDIIIKAFTFATSKITAILSDPKNLAAFKQLATSVGSAIRIVFSALTTPEMMRMFRLFIAEAARNIPIIARGMASFFTAMARIGIAAGPLLRTLVDGFAKLMKSFADSTGDRKGLSDFFAMAGKHLGAWLALGKAIFQLLGVTIKGAAPAGLILVTALTGGIVKLTNWMNSHQKEVKQFFQQAVDVTLVLMDVVVKILPILLSMFNPDALKAFVGFIVGVLVPAFAGFVLTLNQIWIILGAVFGNSFIRQMAQAVAILIGVVVAWKLLEGAITLTKWALRMLELEPITVIFYLIAAALIYLELKFHWIEKAIAAIPVALSALRTAFWAVIHFVQDNWPIIVAVLTGGIGIAVMFIISHVDDIRHAFWAVINWVKENWPLILAILTGPFGLLVYFLIKHWDTVKATFWTVINWIRDEWWKIVHFLEAPFIQLGRDMASLWDTAVRGITAAWDKIRQVFWDTWHWIDKNVIQPMKDAWDWITSGFGLFSSGKAPTGTQAEAINRQLGPLLGGSGGTGGTGGRGFDFSIVPRQAGGIEHATPGGRPILVAEGGHDEYVISTDPKHKTRSLGLISEVLGKLGQGFDKGGDTGILPGLPAHPAKLSLFEKTIYWLRDNASSIVGGHPTAGVNDSILALMAIIAQRFGGTVSTSPLGVVTTTGRMTATSTTDHRAKTSAGNPSDHPAGKAIDMQERGGVNDERNRLMIDASEWIKSSGLYRYIKQGIHNPNLAINAKTIQTPPGDFADNSKASTWSEHKNHIHLAAEQSDIQNIIRYLGVTRLGTGVMHVPLDAGSPTLGVPPIVKPGDYPQMSSTAPPSADGGGGPGGGGPPGTTYQRNADGSFSPTTKQVPLTFDEYFLRLTGNKVSEKATRFLVNRLRRWWEEDPQTKNVKVASSGAGDTTGTQTQESTDGGISGQAIPATTELGRQFNAALAASPMRGLGQNFVEAGKKYGIDPRLPFAIAQHESQYGAAGYARGTNNPFGYGVHIGIKYGSWAESIDNVTKHLTQSPYGGKSLHDIIYTYAPPGGGDGNDTEGYIKFLRGRIKDLGGNPDNLFYDVGGELPGKEGTPVPIIAHAGEMILNREQQQKLGGPSFLKKLFGFGGEVKREFDGGGIAAAGASVSAGWVSASMALVASAATAAAKALGGLTSTAASTQDKKAVLTTTGQEATAMTNELSELIAKGPNALVLQMTDELKKLPEAKLLTIKMNHFNSLMQTFTNRLAGVFDLLGTEYEQLTAHLNANLAEIKIRYNAVTGQVTQTSAATVLGVTLKNIGIEHNKLMGNRGLLQKAMDSALTELKNATINFNKMAETGTAGQVRAAKTRVENAKGVVTETQTRIDKSTTDLSNLAQQEHDARQQVSDLNIAGAQATVTLAEAELSRLGTLGRPDIEKVGAMQAKADGLKGVNAQIQKNIDKLVDPSGNALPGEEILVAKLRADMAANIASIEGTALDISRITRQYVEEGMQNQLTDATNKLQLFDIMGGPEAMRIALADYIVGLNRTFLSIYQTELDAELAKIQPDPAEVRRLTDLVASTKNTITQGLADAAQREFDVLETNIDRTLTIHEQNIKSANTRMNLATAGAQTTDFGATAYGLALNKGTLQQERSGLRDQIDNVLLDSEGNMKKPEDINWTLFKTLNEAMDKNTEKLEDNTLATRDNTRAAFQSNVDQIKGNFGAVIGLHASLARSAELTGNTTGQKASIQSELDAMTIERDALVAKAPKALEDYNSGVMSGKDYLDFLTSINDLNNTITETNQLLHGLGQAQSFASATWRWFRQAVFTGAGGLLPSMDPAMAVPGAAAGGFIKKEGLVHLHAGEVVTPPGGTVGGDTNVHVNVTNPTEVADPIYLGQRMAWEMKTAR